MDFQSKTANLQGRDTLKTRKTHNTHNTHHTHYTHNTHNTHNPSKSSKSRETHQGQDPPPRQTLKIHQTTKPSQSIPTKIPKDEGIELGALSRHHFRVHRSFCLLVTSSCTSCLSDHRRCLWSPKLPLQRTHVLLKMTHRTQHEDSLENTNYIPTDSSPMTQ